MYYVVDSWVSCTKTSFLMWLCYHTCYSAVLLNSFSLTIQEFCLLHIRLVDFGRGTFRDYGETKLFGSIHLSKPLDSVCVTLHVKVLVLLFECYLSLLSWGIHIRTILWVILTFFVTVFVYLIVGHTFFLCFFPYFTLQKPSFTNRVLSLSAVV